MATEAEAGPAAKRDPIGIALTAGAVVLTLATAYIHSTLGGPLFTLNAVGYAVLAAGLVVPLGPLARFRYLVRLALLGFTLATIGGWILWGARYDVAYLDKAIELALVVLLVAMIVRFDGGPAGVVARLRTLPSDLAAIIQGPR